MDEETEKVLRPFMDEAEFIEPDPDPDPEPAPGFEFIHNSEIIGNRGDSLSLWMQRYRSTSSRFTASRIFCREGPRWPWRTMKRSLGIFPAHSINSN